MTDAAQYSIEVKKVTIEGEEYFRARIKEFPHLDEFAETAKEAYSRAIEAIELSCEILTSQGKSAPAPAEDQSESFSGRITLRVPKSLHASLVSLADQEDVSLNQLIVSALSDFNGFSSHKRYQTIANKAEVHLLSRKTLRSWSEPRPQSAPKQTEWSLPEILQA